MKKYLLDTNICIYFIKGQFELNKKIAEVSEQNCFILEITIAELKYGVEVMRKIVEAFIPKFFVIPIYNSLDIYAKEKAKLKKRGLPIVHLFIKYF